MDPHNHIPVNTETGGWWAETNGWWEETLERTEDTDTEDNTSSVGTEDYVSVAASEEWVRPEESWNFEIRRYSDTLTVNLPSSFCEVTARYLRIFATFTPPPPTDLQATPTPEPLTWMIDIVTQLFGRVLTEHEVFFMAKAFIEGDSAAANEFKVCAMIELILLCRPDKNTLNSILAHEPRLSNFFAAYAVAIDMMDEILDSEEYDEHFYREMKRLFRSRGENQEKIVALVLFRCLANHIFRRDNRGTKDAFRNHYNRVARILENAPARRNPDPNILHQFRCSFNTECRDEKARLIAFGVLKLAFDKVLETLGWGDLTSWHGWDPAYRVLDPSVPVDRGVLPAPTAPGQASASVMLCMINYARELIVPFVEELTKTITHPPTDPNWTEN